MGRLAANLITLALGVVGGLLMLELALRLAGFGPINVQPDPLIGFRRIPHSRYRFMGDRRIGEGGSAGRFNSMGFRDVDHATAKPPGTTRILVIGDSFVAAYQVALDSTFHRRLERALNSRALPGRHFEVIALGENGNGTTTEYLTYRAWGAGFDPDVVALLFILNDQADNWRPVALDQQRPFYVDDGDSLRLDTSFNQEARYRKWRRWFWLKSHSALYNQLQVALATLRTRLRPPREPGGQVELGYYVDWNFDRRFPADSIPAFRLTERILARFADQVRRDHRRFVVFVAGFAQQEDHRLLAENLRDPDFDPDKARRWLAGVGQRHGFEVVSLTPAFRAASTALDRPLWFGSHGYYGHWNGAGHAVTAGVMERYFAHTLAGLDTTGLDAPATAAP
jgi:hypothetical protein